MAHSSARRFGISFVVVGVFASLWVFCVGDDPGATSSPSPSGDGGVVGELGGKCFDDGKCKEGLVCEQGIICLRPDGGSVSDGSSSNDGAANGNDGGDGGQGDASLEGCPQLKTNAESFDCPLADGGVITCVAPATFCCFGSCVQNVAQCSNPKAYRCLNGGQCPNSRCCVEAAPNGTAGCGGTTGFNITSNGASCVNAGALCNPSLQLCSLKDAVGCDTGKTCQPLSLELDPTLGKSYVVYACLP